MTSQAMGSLFMVTWALQALTMLVVIFYGRR